jgi:general secretion pathway protein M
MILKRLNRRERYAVYGALGFLCIFVLLQFAVFPFMDKKARLKRMIEAKSETHQELINLKFEYDALGKKVELSKVRLSQRNKGFTLFSFLDKLAGRVGVKDNIKYMKPSSSTQKNSPYKISRVEMKIEAVSMDQLKAYLYRIETSKNMIRIRRIAITKTEKPKGFVNVILEVEAVQI